MYYFEQESVDIATIELNTPVPGIQRDSDNNTVRNDSWAAFTQWTYHFTEELGLTLGARYTEDKKRSIPDQFDYAAPTIPQVPRGLYKETFTDFTPSGSVNYRWSEEAMTYVSYSKGFKGGGWNSHFNAVQTAQQLAVLHQFGPEEAESIELGFKLDLLDRTLRLNGAVFTTDYTDLQITYRVVGVNNATDELYAIAGNSSLTTGSGYAEIAYARPREYFGQVTYEF